MTTEFIKETLIADIVTQVPQASDILKGYRIDFCCGGNRSIGEAIEERQLNEQEILEKLNAVLAKSLEENILPQWEEATFTEIIDHIIHKHHSFLYQELPALGQFVTKVARVHGGTRHELLEVYRLFNDLKSELEQHTIKEEQTVFPLIKGFEANPNSENLAKLKEVIKELEDEHTGAGDLLKKLREVTADYLLPEGACMTYQLTYRRLDELESDLFQHIHLENNILFPRVIQASSN